MNWFYFYGCTMIGAACWCCTYLISYGVFFILLSGKGSIQHKKYIEFDTKHYTRKSKFSVFWHKKYIKLPRVWRVLELLVIYLPGGNHFILGDHIAQYGYRATWPLCLCRTRTLFFSTRCTGLKLAFAMCKKNC